MRKKRPPVAALITKVEGQIYVIRGQRVMLDSDLAKLYGVPTGRLNEQVRRNRGRFPEDFAFQLTQQEFKRLFQLRTFVQYDSRLTPAENGRFSATRLVTFCSDNP